MGRATLDTYTYSRSAFVPTKTLTARKIHSYNDLRKLAKLHFWIFLFIIFFFFYFFVVVVVVVFVFVFVFFFFFFFFS